MILSPSKKQIELWLIISNIYYLKFLNKNEEWNEYLYDIGITIHLNRPKSNEFDVPNPSGEGILGIAPELAEDILKSGMPWRVYDSFKENT